MGSVLRRVRNCERSLGEVQVLQREQYEGLELNAKVERIRSLIPPGCTSRRCSRRKSSRWPVPVTCAPMA